MMAPTATYLRGKSTEDNNKASKDERQHKHSGKNSKIYKCSHTLKDMVKMNSMFNEIRETNKEIKNILRRLYGMVRLMTARWVYFVHLD
jgi:hypothetical protein